MKQTLDEVAQSLQIYKRFEKMWGKKKAQKLLLPSIVKWLQERNGKSLP